MHPLCASQRDAAMIILQPACAARLCDLTLLLGVLAYLDKQRPGAAQKPREQNTDSETQDE